MAADVDIVNLALALLGDTATVASINPPSGDAQAAMAAQMFPIARDSTLEMHAWNFATTRVSLAQIATNPATTWTYAYAGPSNCIRVLEVLASDSVDEYSVGVPGASDNMYAAPYGIPISNFGAYVPATYEIEANPADGSPVILTNVGPDAVLRYVMSVTDTTKWSPLFVRTMAHVLASMLAGPLLKGDAGIKETQNQMALAERMLGRAAGSDANQRNVKPPQGPTWMLNR